jgi:uncharacterized protein with GYD domain
MVMSEYDYVGIAEVPSDEVAATFLLGLGFSERVRTTTLKAFATEQIAEIVGRLS